MRVIVTGSCYWTDYDSVESALYEAWSEAWASDGRVLVIRGNAPGVDQMASAAVRVMEPLGFEEVVYTGPGYAERMVGDGADICLSFIKLGQGNNLGTVTTMALAARARIPIFQTTG